MYEYKKPLDQYIEFVNLTGVNLSYKQRIGDSLIVIMWGFEKIPENVVISVWKGTILENIVSSVPLKVKQHEDQLNWLQYYLD